MEFDRDSLLGTADAVAYRGTKPPRMVLHAIASLVGARIIRRAAVAKTKLHDGGTAWAVVGIVDNAVLSVRAVSGHADWDIDGSGSHQYTGELSEARLVPLAEVCACAVSTVEPSQEWGTPNLLACNPSWRITLRDGTSIAIPRTYGDSGDELARELIDLIISA